MPDISRAQVFLCNGAPTPPGLEDEIITHLEYRQGQSAAQNVNISLPDFVQSVTHLPDRILDLMEIAAYVFSADRLARRGGRDAVEYHSWSRRLWFCIRVRDVDFWQRSSVQEAMSQALGFMTGDAGYCFTFTGGHKTSATSLFDQEKFSVPGDRPVAVVLFSGGLDSLAGVLKLLSETDKHLCLASHQSQWIMRRTQTALVSALRDRAPNRIHHFRYECSLKGDRAVDENQRTRAFLYGSIAFAVASAFGQANFFVFENGVTALNFPKRQDMMNARASRTTHPRTLALLSDLLSMLAERRVTIHTPFAWNTKRDIFEIVDRLNGRNLIPSTVSCSKVFKVPSGTTHCGTCSQCIDRRFAAHSAGMGAIDHCGLYSCDFLAETTLDGEAKTMITDYVRQARGFAGAGIDQFYREHLSELAEVFEGFPGLTEQEVVERTFALCQRHGTHVSDAIRRMCQQADPYAEVAKGSFLDLLSAREYLKPPVERLIAAICECLDRALPVAFQREARKDENRLNNIVEALLAAHGNRFKREHPHLSFACGHAVPDHSAEGVDLYVECKYIRGHTKASKASEGIAADLTKYGGVHTLFIVYDPTGQIVDREKFKSDFEGRGNCTVQIVS